MEAEGSLPHSQGPAILTQINPVHAPIPILKNHFNIIAPSTAESSKLSLSLRSPQPKPCLHLTYPPYVLHVPPISFFYSLTENKY